MKNFFLLLLFFLGISLSASAAEPTTWVITTADGDNSAGTFSRVFRYDAEDGDIIEFDIEGTDEIVLEQVLERRADKAERLLPLMVSIKQPEIRL